MTHDTFSSTRRGALSAGVVGFVGVTAGLVGVASAKQPIRVPGEYSSIQAAVDAANPGDTVLVDGGTYREQVFIDKDLDLRGMDATIEAVDSPVAVEIVESPGSTWEPMVFAYGGSLASGSVSGSGTVDVSITGFELDGRSTQPTARRKAGILYRNADGHVAENDVHHLGVGGKETMGILAYGNSTVRIEGNVVSEFERGGIGANGDGGAHPSPSVEVLGNDLDAVSAPYEGWAPNGVQVGYGATGRVERNAIRNCRWATDTDSWLASGVLVFESDGVSVRRNTLEHNDVAVAVSSWGWLLDSADNCKITGNESDNSLIGVNLRAQTFDVQDSSVSNTKVVDNTLTGGSLGETGILVSRYDPDDGYDARMRNNKIIRNHITGFTTSFEDSGTATKAHAFEP